MEAEKDMKRRLRKRWRLTRILKSRSDYDKETKEDFEK